MAEQRPAMAASLEWDGERQFTGRVGPHEVGIDGSAATAPTPVQLLALSLAGCMAIDLVHILGRGRHPLGALRAEMKVERAAEEPRRLTRVEIHFTLAGDLRPDHVQRAIDLSREKYCSVWHSLRHDIDLSIGFTLDRPAEGSASAAGGR
jgi:putative redox protein